MSCRETHALLSYYLDGLLEAAKTRALEQHIEGCSECRHKLELMQAIPQALQTDRMLAPNPEFTTLVMQKIVITTQIQNRAVFRAEFSSETHYTLRRSSANPVAQPETDKAKTSNEASFMRLTQSTQLRAVNIKSPSVYVLRFSSVAAALVLAIGIGLYALQLNNVAATGTANASVAIGFFAQTLTEALQSPNEVIMGVIVAGVVVVTLWVVFRKNGMQQPLTSGDFTPESEREYETARKR